MIRPFLGSALLAAAVAGPAAANEWSIYVETPMVTTAIDGETIGYGDSHGAPEWSYPIAYLTNQSTFLPCSKLERFELSYFGGYDAPGWEVHVIVDLERTSEGWLQDYPTVFFAEVDAESLPVRQWEAFDADVRLDIEELSCVSDELMQVTLSAKAELTGLSGAVDIPISLRASGPVVISLDDE